ncbi:MAG: FAD-binding domain-containing protein [Pseudomonadota bacterium]
MADMLKLVQPADRKTALHIAQEFQPKMGKRYASGRNHDRGAGRHTAVSCLSPYTRRRIITEQELVQLALDEHGLEGAEKFIQEVFWRSYFKGWLERRPSIWTEYTTSLETLSFALDESRRMRKDYDAAIEGRTGIECFDVWANELVETGYLHNHARMWFASIWIFTLRLPWGLGADFFYTNLLDGDPASNTCSWRWVAGLHTLGKTYAASAWNIKKFSDGRFKPNPKDFATVTGPVDPDAVLPDVSPVRGFVSPGPTKPSVLVITEEDCSADLSFFPDMKFDRVIALKASHLRGTYTNPLVTEFEENALKDACERLTEMGLPEPEFFMADDPAPLLEAVENGQQLVTAFIPVGPLRDWLTSHGIPLTEVQRDWDAEIWPAATAGFFKVKKKIPTVLSKMNML